MVVEDLLISVGGSSGGIVLLAVFLNKRLQAVENKLSFITGKMGFDFK